MGSGGRVAAICCVLWACAAFAELPPSACVPTMRPDRQWWSLSRHAEIISRLAQGEIRTNNVYDLVLVGDSITHRWENPANGASVYPKLTSRYRVLNLGCGGDQTQHVLWRLDHGALGQDYKYTARVFAVMIGVNNGESDPEGVAQGVKRVLDRIRTAHPESKIILMPILPCFQKPLASVRQTVINPLIKKLADDETVFWLDFNDRFLGADGEIKSGLMMPDKLHPIAAGYEIWLKALCPMVDKLIEK